MFLVSFVDEVRLGLALFGHGIISTLSADDISSLSLDVIFVIFFVFAEGWIWFERLRVWWFISVVDTLNENYRLTPAKDRIKALEARWRVHDNLSWRAIKRRAGSGSARRSRSWWSKIFRPSGVSNDH
jgi:hypothetical protein